MAKIAVGDDRVPGRTPATSEPPARRLLVSGPGWSVSDVRCTAGPHDRVFEEQHVDVCIAIVLAGSFQYRSAAGRELMTPGSLLLGNAGQYFECGHEHAVGDRCLSFSFDRHWFEAVAAEAGVTGSFATVRVPPVRELSPVVSGVCARLAQADGSAPSSTAGWEEVALELAVRTLDTERGIGPTQGSSPSAEARVTRTLRMIDSRPDEPHDLDALAKEARLSRYHFLRMFRQLTGVTPHQYVLRARLRAAATRLALEPSRVVEIALDCGFGDVSNFNRAFRAEFGVTPRAYRTLAR